MDENKEQVKEELSNDIHQLTQEKQEKIKKNLMWVAIFSIIMLFAGVTSGYIVASGTDFWVNLNLPTQFTLSTVIILISSLSLWGATFYMKQNKSTFAGILVGITLILGIVFGVFQVKGYNNLQQHGNAANAGIINFEGKYGDYYTLFYQNKEISFDGEKYFWQGSQVDQDLQQKMVGFCQTLKEVAREDEQKIDDYGIFMVKYKGAPVLLQNNKLVIDGKVLNDNQKYRLFRFSEAIASGRGDFIIIGQYGKDFTLNYKGKPVQYENRKFYLNGQELSEYQLNTLYSAPNRTSGFIFAFVFLHILHWLAGIIVLIVLLIKSLKHKYTAQNYIGLKIGSIYWHFLGILWLYLYLFLIFFH
ncbi:MAG: cytochrome c oxidase subunit 3 [Putridiphycobacter sp.]